ncbi:MAG: DUF6174 domain-containing protein [Planctomycetota bacterium]
MSELRDPETPTAPSGSRACLPFFIGLLLAIGIGMYLLSGKLRAQAMPVLERERFDQAWQQWQQTGPESYRICIKVEGRQPAEYSCTVHNREVVLATRNARPLTQVRTMGTWSVPGMFDTIEYDVRAIAGDNMTEQQKAVTDLIVRCKFDPEYGYPKEYLRSDFAMKTTTRWQVTEFRILNAEDLEEGIQSLNENLIDYESEEASKQ